MWNWHRNSVVHSKQDDSSPAAVLPEPASEEADQSLTADFDIPFEALALHRQKQRVRLRPAAPVAELIAALRPLAGNGHSRPLIAAVAANYRSEATSDIESDAVLELFAKLAQSFTAASGVAVGLLCNERMICRASTGATAPMRGTILDGSASFSAECVRSGAALCCNDTEDDPRVNVEACRCLGVRSILAIPLLTSGTVFGLVEVFSAIPRAFNPSHITLLQLLFSLDTITLAKLAVSPQERVPADPPASIGMRAI